MRSAKQTKAITAQLEVLGELKDHLQDVVAKIENVLQIGTSWIQEENNTTFNEMTSFLATETSTYFQRCLNLGNGDEGLSQPSCKREEDKSGQSVFYSQSTSKSSGSSIIGKENQKWAEKIAELEKNIVKQTKTIKRNYKDQAKDTNELFSILKEDMEKKIDFKFKEITKELEAASDFMLDLHSKNVLLTNQVNENLEQQKSMEQKLNNFGKEIVSKDNVPQRKGFAEINERMSENSKSIQEIKTQVDSLMKSLKNVDKILEGVCSQRLAETKNLNQKIGNAASEVKEILPHIRKIESTKFEIGFEACAEDTNIYCQGTDILTCFTKMIQDLDYNFDTDTGIYTVPLDGIYQCALFIEISSFVKDDMFFGIYLKTSKKSNGKEAKEEVIASCHTKVNFQTVCDASTRKCKSGDKLYVKYNIIGEDEVEFSSHSHFTCVLLDPC